MVEAVGVTVIDVPFPAWVPPHEPEYHSQLAFSPNEPPVNVNVEEAEKQTTDGDALADVAAAEDWLIVTEVLPEIVQE